MATRFCLALSTLIAAFAPVAAYAEEAIPAPRPIADQLVGNHFEQASTENPPAYVYVRVSRDFLAKRFERKVDRVKPVTDHILGTDIVGKSHTRGTTQLILLPSADGVRAQVEFTGTCHSHSRGTNGPVILRYEGKSTFRGTKEIRLTATGFTTLPAEAQAETRLHTNNIRTRRNGPFSSLVERIAWQRVDASRHEANVIASRHTAERIAIDLNSKLDGSLDKLTAKFVESFLVAAGLEQTELASLATCGAGRPLHMRFRSTPAYVELAMSPTDCTWQDLEGTLPNVVGNPHVAVRVHRSFVTQAATSTDKSPTIARLLLSALHAQLTETTAALVQASTQPPDTQSTWSVDLDWLAINLDQALFNRLASSH